MDDRRARIPTVIAGWPTEVRSFRMGNTAVELVGVASLESQLDRERLLRDDDFEPPYWALIWSGAVLLASWVERDRIGSGLRTLDVGCGLGLVALIAAKVGARVTALDREPVALEFLAQSAALAGLELELSERDLVDLHPSQAYEVITAAEVLYERDGFPELVRAVDRLLAPGGRLYLADSFRVDTRGFYAELERYSFLCDHEQSTFVDEEGTRVRVRLACYRRAADS